jgi:dTMP kinase
MPRGLFLSFEGADGTGKSTQIRLLRNKLRQCGYKVLTTREPGGTRPGEMLRKILKRQKLDAWTETFILEASRRELINQVIAPALRKGYVIISDRFEDSTLVYQGLVKGLPLPMLKGLNALAVQGVKPSRVYLLSSPRLRLGSKSKHDKFDQESGSFHEKVRKGFLTLARKDRRFLIVDANQSRQEVHAQLVQDLSRWLPKLKSGNEK